MGFFSRINPIRAITRILPAPVNRVIAPVVKLATAVTELNPQTFVALASKGPVLGPINFAAQTLAPRYAPYVNLGSSVATAFVPGGGVTTMALNLGGILGSVGSLFGGNQNPYFQGVSNLASLAGQFVPQQSAQTVAMRAPQAVGPLMRSVPTVGRGFFQKYPNLATAIQGLRNMGRKVTRGQLYSMLKRFGPEILISAGILTAAAVSELMVAGPGRRRMNPGNVSALRRSMRRLESFHKLCVTSDKLRRPGRRSGKGCKTGSGTFVRQG